MTATSSPSPSPEEEGQARAYMAGVVSGFGILLEEWHGRPDGTAVHEIADGTRLIHTPLGHAPFTYVIPCTRHNEHRVGVHDHTDLARAHAAVQQCTRRFRGFFTPHQAPQQRAEEEPNQPEPLDLTPTPSVTTGAATTVPHHDISTGAVLTNVPASHHREST